MTSRADLPPIMRAMGDLGTSSINANDINRSKLSCWVGAFHLGMAVAARDPALVAPVMAAFEAYATDYAHRADIPLELIERDHEQDVETVIRVLRRVIEDEQGEGC